ncbi:TIGR02281 family clan AA aspartic protease [Lutimaribacter marinistellae]|uniref:TIGR02281 family clan AA aspartic protease n=1 Tax=Lutimaribacter marinistellae TaxID=1820329 RepID=A0ABV7TK86_9RHOB
MDGTDVASVLYLALLGAALLFWYFTHHRANLGKTVQQAAAWVFIFIGVIAVVGLWEDIRGTVSPSSSMVVTEESIRVPRGPDGHYYLRLLVNDTPVEFLVDTGASQVVLTNGDARRIGVDLDNLNFFGRAMTANGEVRIAPVELDTITLGEFEDRGVTAWVNEGQMDRSLLGMTYLNRWASVSIADGALVLTR